MEIMQPYSQKGSFISEAGITKIKRAKQTQQEAV